MKRITEESINAFYANKRFKQKNTEVYIEKDNTQLKLYNHTIAILYDNGLLKITTAGWNTHTTRDRLNGLKNVSVKTKLGQLYLNNKKWDGEIITINKEYKNNDFGKIIKNDNFHFTL